MWFHQRKGSIHWFCVRRPLPVLPSGTTRLTKLAQSCQLVHCKKHHQIWLLVTSYFNGCFRLFNLKLQLINQGRSNQLKGGKKYCTTVALPSVLKVNSFNYLLSFCVSTISYVKELLESQNPIFASQGLRTIESQNSSGTSHGSIFVI